MYTLNLQTGVVLRDSDGVQVAPFDYPPDDGEKAYQDWLIAGNDPTPYIAPVVVNPAALEAAIGAAVQALLDAQAQALGYDSMLSAVTYFGSTVPQFAADAARLKPWRDACWAYCYGVLAQVQAGTVPAPTVDVLIAGLPQLAA